MEPTYVSCIRVVESLSEFPHAPSHSVITRKQFVFILSCHAACRAGVVVSGRGELAAWWVEQREPVECFRCMGSETKADTEQTQICVS